MSEEKSSVSEGMAIASRSLPSRLHAWKSAIRLALRHQRAPSLFGISLGIALFLLVVTWLVRDTAIYATPTAIPGDHYEELLYKAQRLNLDHFQLWYKLNIIIQCTLIVAALLAAIFASVTTRENAESLKKWSVLLTAVTAAVASFQATFHIRENLDSFIQATIDMNLVEADYLADRAKFVDELKDKATTETNIQLLELHRKYMGRLNNIVGSRMHALTNIGSQPAPRASPAATK